MWIFRGKPAAACTGPDSTVPLTSLADGEMELHTSSDTAPALQKRLALNPVPRGRTKGASGGLLALFRNTDSSSKGLVQSSYLQEPAHSRLATRWKQQSPKPWAGLREIPTWRNPCPRAHPKNPAQQEQADCKREADNSEGEKWDHNALENTEKELLDILRMAQQLVRPEKICLQWFNTGPTREKHSRVHMIQPHISHRRLTPALPLHNLTPHVSSKFTVKKPLSSLLSLKLLLGQKNSAAGNCWKTSVIVPQKPVVTLLGLGALQA